MTVPFVLTRCAMAPELPHHSAVISFHRPIGLGLVGRGTVLGYTQQPENTLVVYRGKLRSTVRRDRVGDAIRSHPSINEC